MFTEMLDDHVTPRTRDPRSTDVGRRKPLREAFVQSSQFIESTEDFSIPRRLGPSTGHNVGSVVTKFPNRLQEFPTTREDIVYGVRERYSLRSGQFTFPIVDIQNYPVAVCR